MAGITGSWRTRGLMALLLACACAAAIPAESSAKPSGLVAEPVKGGPPAAYLLGTIGKRALYFDEVGTGADLYVTNGKRTKRIRRAAPTASPRAAAPHPAVERAQATSGGRIVFASTDSEHGLEWWGTDGTSAGTRLLVDAMPGPDSSVGQYDLPVYLGGDTVVIPVTDAEHGREWWVTDGTPEGTHLITDINPGPSSSHFDFTQVDRVAAGGLMYFTAKSNDASQTQQLWRTDGTAAGTFSLGVHMMPGGLTGGAVDGEFLFSAGPTAAENEVWRTDGTLGGTRPYFAFPTGTPGSGGFTTAGGRLFIGINSTLWLVETPDSPPVELRNFGATGNGLTGVQKNSDNRSAIGETFGENLYFFVLGGQPPANITVDDWISLGTPETTRPLSALDRECASLERCTDGNRLFLSQVRGKRTILKTSAGTRKSERRVATGGKQIGLTPNGLARAADGTYFINSAASFLAGDLWKVHRRR